MIVISVLIFPDERPQSRSAGPPPLSDTGPDLPACPATALHAHVCQPTSQVPVPPAFRRLPEVYWGSPCRVTLCQQVGPGSVRWDLPALNQLNFQLHYLFILCYQGIRVVLCGIWDKLQTLLLRSVFIFFCMLFSYFVQLNFVNYHHLWSGLFPRPFIIRLPFLDASLARRKDVRLTKEQESRLPSHWLKSKGAHTTMADALWRLRDLMLRDTLNIRQAQNPQNV